MWRRVDPVKWTDVSEERIASIFRVEKSASEEPAWAGSSLLLHNVCFVLHEVWVLHSLSFRIFLGFSRSSLSHIPSWLRAHAPLIYATQVPSISNGTSQFRGSFPKLLSNVSISTWSLLAHPANDLRNLIYAASTPRSSNFPRK
jgi:hypothetical protein